MATKKFMSLERLQEYDTLIKQEISKGDSSVKSYVNGELAKKADSTHNHDDKYYTQYEIDAMEFITTDDIDTICGASIVSASEVTF